MQPIDRIESEGGNVVLGGTGHGAARQRVLLRWRGADVDFKLGCRVGKVGRERKGGSLG